MSVAPERHAGRAGGSPVATRCGTRAGSILVMVMIGLPVAAVVFADVVWRTSDLSPSQRADLVLGDQAGALVQQAFPGATDISQTVDPERDGWQSPQGASTGTQISVAVGEDLSPADLPSGWTTVSRETVGFARFLSADEARVAPAELLEFRYADPLVTGLVRQLDGLVPSSQDEVVVTRPLADRLDLDVGDTLIPSDRSQSFHTCRGCRAAGRLELRDRHRRPRCAVRPRRRPR